jgi:RNA-binding protein
MQIRRLDGSMGKSPGRSFSVLGFPYCMAAALPHPADVTELNNKQISKLKGMGQLIEPIIRIGHAGLSDALIASLNQALNDHELVKVKFSDFKDQKKILSPQLAERTNSYLVMRVGNVVVLYREQADTAKRKIIF